MKKTLLAVTLAALTSGAATTALAADPKAPAPDFEISGSVTFTSDYRFRGSSESNLNPALQAGINVNHASGLYGGVWGSSLNHSLYTDRDIETNLFVGYTFSSMGLDFDIGDLYYYYTDFTGTGSKPHTNEIYFSVGYGPLSFKNSYATTKYFGVTDSKGHLYSDLTLTLPLNDTTSVYAHAGYANGEGNTADSGTDFKIGVTTELNGFGLALDYVDNSGDLARAAKTAASGAVKDVRKSGVVLSLSKSF
ncbi:Conserved hypothetical protein CHP02001 [Burkholderiales bacterium]